MMRAFHESATSNLHAYVEESRRQKALVSLFLKFGDGDLGNHEPRMVGRLCSDSFVNVAARHVDGMAFFVALRISEVSFIGR